MSHAIEKERRKIREEIAEFDTLIKYIEDRPYKSAHLTDFKKWLSLCRSAMLKDLPLCLDRITEGFPNTEKSRKLHEFRSNIKRLRDLLFSFLLSSEVPRELYCLCDLFLEYNKTPANYMICVYEEIASLPMTYLLKRFGFEETHPKFWGLMSQYEFYFIQVTSSFKETDSAIDWPIVLHEMSHVICKERGIDDLYLQSISIYRSLRVLDQYVNGLLPSGATALVEIATKKLYMTEYLADFFVTKCFAGAFGWRFLEKYVDLIDLFETDRDRAHPAPDKRVQKMMEEIKNTLDDDKIPKFMATELTKLLGRKGTRIDERLARLDTTNIDKEVDPVLTSLIAKLHKEFEYTFTLQRIKDSIEETQWFRVLNDLSGRKTISRNISKKCFNTLLQKFCEDFENATPIVVDPSTLYYLVLLLHMNACSSKKPVDKKHKENLNRLLADSIRLYFVQKVFFS